MKKKLEKHFSFINKKKIFFLIPASDWPIYVGLAIVASVCIALGAILSYSTRKRRQIPTYSVARAEIKPAYYEPNNKQYQAVPTDTIVTANYCYPVSSTGRYPRFPPPRPISEHHYDEPHLMAK